MCHILFFLNNFLYFFSRLANNNYNIVYADRSSNQNPRVFCAEDAFNVPKTGRTIDIIEFAWYN